VGSVLSAVGPFDEGRFVSFVDRVIVGGGLPFDVFVFGRGLRLTRGVRLAHAVVIGCRLERLTLASERQEQPGDDEERRKLKRGSQGDEPLYR
jgi:hypothetical protein